MLKVLSEVKELGQLSASWECGLYHLGEKIGYSEVHLIEGGRYLADYLEQADIYSPWVPYDAMLSIEFDGEKGLTEKIGYIHSLVILKEHRGKGYLKHYLEGIENFAKKSGMKAIILQPCPLENNDTNSYLSDRGNLCKLYETKGYQEFETIGFMRNPYHFKLL